MSHDVRNSFQNHGNRVENEHNCSDKREPKYGMQQPTLLQRSAVKEKKLETYHKNASLAMENEFVHNWLARIEPQNQPEAKVSDQENQFSMISSPISTIHDQNPQY
jgi:hypothetical protein